MIENEHLIIRMNAVAASFDVTKNYVREEQQEQLSQVPCLPAAKHTCSLWWQKCTVCHFTSKVQCAHSGIS